ncbi:MAG: hypothetical protein NVS2B7_12670 [Herpetosiphon sp.]
MLRTDDNRFVLIDGGSDGEATVRWLGRELPFWRRRLDLVLLTHADDQTLPGQVAVLQRYGAERIAHVVPQKPSTAWSEWQRLAARATARLTTLQQGEQFAVGESRIVVCGAGPGWVALALDVQRRRVYDLHALGINGAALAAEQIDHPAALVLFPWRVRPDEALLQRMQTGMVIYGSGGTSELQQSFAERWDGKARLFHPAIHGRLEWRPGTGRDALVVERQP